MALTHWQATSASTVVLLCDSSFYTKEATEAAASLAFSFGQPVKLPSLQAIGPQRRRKRGSRAPLAAISWGFPFLGSGGSQLRADIQTTYGAIDADNSGSLSRAELEAYALSHGLPTAYISQFMEAVLRNGKRGGRTDNPASGDSQHQPLATPQHPQQAGAHQPPEQEAEITYHAFARYIESREQALKKAFDMFDKDKDGRISVQDLEASLAHVAVCCPRTRVVYRCPRSMARAMLQRTAAMGATDGRSVDFPSFRRFFMLLPETDMAMSYWLRAGAAPELTEKMVAVHDAGDPAKASAWGHLFAGAVAGAASRTATAPLETLRLAVMTGSLQGTGNLAQAASSIVEAHGWKGLYRGNALNVLRSAPQKALDFWCFDLFKRLIMGDSNNSKDRRALTESDAAARTFIAAGLAGMTSWATLYPIETVRSRITAGTTPAGAGIAAVLRGIVRSEGVGALYRGLGWSLAGIFPEAALCYGLHDQLKHMYRQTHGGQEPGVLPSLAAGVVSAFAGQLVAFPLETVARRLQVHKGPGGLSTVLKGIWDSGGPLAFYRGVGAATIRLVPMAIVSFGTYELVRSVLLSLEEQAERAEAEKEYSLSHNTIPLAMTLTLTQRPPPPQVAACSPAGDSALGQATLASSSLDTSACCSAAAAQEKVAVCVDVSPSSCSSSGPSAGSTPCTSAPTGLAGAAAACQPLAQAIQAECFRAQGSLPLASSNPLTAACSAAPSPLGDVSWQQGRSLAVAGSLTLAAAAQQPSPLQLSRQQTPGPCTSSSISNPRGKWWWLGRKRGRSALTQQSSGGLLPTATPAALAHPGSVIVLLPEPITPCTQISMDTRPAAAPAPAPAPGAAQQHSPASGSPSSSLSDPAAGPCSPACVPDPPSCPLSGPTSGTTAASCGALSQQPCTVVPVVAPADTGTVTGTVTVQICTPPPPVCQGPAPVATPFAAVQSSRPCPPTPPRKGTS